MNYKEYFVTKFLRSTFIGFIITCVIMYLKPELQNSLVIIYGLLAGKNAFELHTGKPKEPTDGKT